MLETLGQYKMLDRVGAGRLGEVYRARDTRLGRTVAIKVLPAELAADPEQREALMRDARAASRLSHPNIAALYEVGEDAGQDFLVFEFVPGATLRTVIAGRPLNPRRAVDLAIQLADALAEAHAQGIVQRDIGPDNVIVTPKGSAKILDFGLAAWAAGAGAGDTLAPRAVAYMSPEQVLGQTVNDRTDIFSLGVMLFEMLTGRLPYAGATTAALSQQIVETPAAAPSSVNRSLPRELDAVVAKALAKNADKRYEAAMLAADLRSIGAMLDARSGAAEPMTVAPVARRRRRVRSATVSALAAVCVLLALLLVWLAVTRGWIGGAWLHALGFSAVSIAAMTRAAAGRCSPRTQ
jgi:serine/threonine protein kinase